MKNIKKAKKGFTIVELVIVIGVIGVLAGILIPTFVNVTQRANEARDKAERAGAFSSYIAEASLASGEIETPKDHVVGYGVEPNTADTTRTFYLEIVKQTEVVLKKGTDTFVFENENWTQKAVTVTTEANSVCYFWSEGETPAKTYRQVQYNGYEIYNVNSRA